MTQQRESRTGRKRLQIVGGVVVGLAVVGLGVRMAEVHSSTGDWGVVASTTPTKLSFDGQDYLKGSKVGPLYSLPEAVVAAGKTDGGGQIYIPRHNSADGSTPNWIAVSSGGIEYSYATQGGG